MRTQPQTYAVTIVCSERMRLFQRPTNATLLIDTLFRYRDNDRFALHGFVVMPDHLHLVLSPMASLEQAIGLVKGGFSFAVRTYYKGPVWQDGYYAHRVVDRADYDGQLTYIERNPQRKQYKDYPFVHTCYSNRLDSTPPHLGG